MNVSTTKDSYLPCEAAVLVWQVYFENILLAPTPNPRPPAKVRLYLGNRGNYQLQQGLIRTRFSRGIRENCS